MTIRIDFDRMTYDRTTRTLFKNLEVAVRAAGGSVSMDDLRHFTFGHETGRFVDMEENDSFDLKAEVWTDLRALGVQPERLNGDLFMKIDDLIDAALNGGFGTQLAISDAAKSIYQRSLEA